MVKDIHYYRSFDLLSASEKIRELGNDRGSSEVFADAIHSLLIAAEERSVGSSEIEQVLGKPDRIVDNEGGEVWEYDWSDMYGPIKYTSLTPFQITNGVCTGLAPDE
ncbi:hypothetical protein Plim_3262 [Planctopirus limnophila DSM 3776]|uniref:Uncharacterized protein n=1 Tax=Planctopirus limnophila (strain ATCC 43296 / DSM 3776 / IFAM 1008 / Mu 290) TaxID=521674 RepID=D5STP6_PLAL2|nr:hypothetical protein [Planctopirus limnophila]ADG69075.1 hypothetical protein Plim_3262 [Planctopirus limnophila DSM 3776]